MKKNPEVEYKKWFVKVFRLKKEISILEELQKKPTIQSPTLSIAVFLLKTQIIEFELRQIIFEFDSIVRTNLNESNSAINRKVRFPKEFEVDTLGKTIHTFREFEGLVPEKLKIDLTKLNSLRKDFTHHLFSPKINYNNLRTDATHGIKLANKILEYTEKVRDLTRKTKNPKSKI